MYQFDKCNFYLKFEGIAKSILFNSILNVAIFYPFKYEKCNYLAQIGGKGRGRGFFDQLTTSENLAPCCPPISLTLAPQYSKPSYAYAGII